MMDMCLGCHAEDWPTLLLHCACVCLDDTLGKLGEKIWGSKTLHGTELKG